MEEKKKIIKFQKFNFNYIFFILFLISSFISSFIQENLDNFKENSDKQKTTDERTKRIHEAPCK